MCGNGVMTGIWIVIIAQVLKIIPLDQIVAHSTWIVEAVGTPTPIAAGQLNVMALALALAVATAWDSA